MINEARLETNVIRLTNHQQQVLAKIAKAETPKMAAADISYGVKIIAARDQLMRDGYIRYNPMQGTAELTDKGLQISVGLGITDEMGATTPKGDELAAIQNESLIEQFNNRNVEL